MTEDEIGALALAYYEKMRANYQSDENVKITPDNVYQEGIHNNYNLFMELVDRLMLPGSGIKGAKNLLETLSLLQSRKSFLFLMKHLGNFDVPCFYSLLSKEGPEYQEILDRLVFIAGRKLNEDSPEVKTFTEVFSRLVIVPGREIPPEGENETPKQEAHRREVLKEASLINRAALRMMIKLKNQGRIIALFPMGGRPKPWLKEKNGGVKETTSYMRIFDFVHFVRMDGNIMPVGNEMKNEKPKRDKVVFSISKPVPAEAYLEKSRELFEKQTKVTDFNQFNVNRVMNEIGQTAS